MKTIRCGIVGIFFCCFFPNPVWPAAFTDFNFKHTASLENQVLEANGRQETILTVSGFGRYAITAESEQGTAVQLIDRMAGPGKISGIAGKKNGRLDFLLDRGNYKILALSHKKGKGDVKLSSHVFKEMNAPNLPRLNEFAKNSDEYKMITTTLDDFQQRSYWIDIQKKRTIVIETAGRNLADLRILKQGQWLMDISPVQEVIEPVSGKSLNRAYIVTTLKPGLYLLSAYGGKARPWAESSNDHPFYLRMGFPRLPEAGRSRFTASPFGLDRWMIPAKANFFRLELPEPDDASITVSNESYARALSGYGIERRITKKTLPAFVEINDHSGSGFKVVTIRSKPGKAYIFQHFERTWSSTFKGSGDYWISTLHSGFGSDNADATAILTEAPFWKNDERLINSSAVRVDSRTRYLKKFNLLDDMTLFLEVMERGEYIVKGQGVRVKFRVEPFLTEQPEDYEAPGYEKSGYKWKLDPGYYVLTAAPEYNGKGIMDMEIVNALSEGRDLPINRASSSNMFERVHLSPRNYYKLYLNHQPGVKAGVLVRHLPIDLAQSSMPVVLEKERMLDLSVQVPESGQLTVITSEGDHLPFSLNAGTAQVNQKVVAGIYNISFQNTEENDLYCSIGFTPKQTFADSPLPVLSADALKTLPDFEKLVPSKPLFFDIGRRERKTFLVQVDEPALYRIESTGLLATEGNLRTRTIVSLDRKQGNGAGRNFLIQQYLREGDYQLTISAIGKSAGHMGLELVKTPLVDGGILKQGVAARHLAADGSAVTYRFDIENKGDFDLKAMGINDYFGIRLEDDDGWPLLKPGTEGNLTQEFAPGSYHMVVLPMPVETRVLAMLEEVKEPLVFKGHGPHLLPADMIGNAIEYIWMEPELGKPRIPDQWEFNASAPVDTTITVNGEMIARLFKASSDKTEAPVRIDSTKDWKGRLEKGKYRLEFKSLYPNNRLDYSFNIQYNQLIPGHSRTFYQEKNVIPISVDSDGRMIEISSFSHNDVRARLVDENGRQTAKNDDRINDWNFLIATPLAKGFYNLHVDTAGEEADVPVTIYVDEPVSTEEAPLTLPAQFTINDRNLHIYPLGKPGKETGDLLLVTASCDDGARIGLEQKQNGKWINLGSDMSKNPYIAFKTGEKDDLGKNNEIRLSVQSVDRRDAPINVNITGIFPIAGNEFQMAGAGLELKPIAGSGAKIGIAAVRLEKPGLFVAQGPGLETLRWGSKSHRLFSVPRKGMISVNDNMLWFIKKMDENRMNRVWAKRVYLKTGKNVQLSVPAGESPFMDLDRENKNTPVALVLVKSRLGKPGVCFEGLNGLPDEKLSGEKLSLETENRLMAVEGQSAVSISLDPKIKTIRVWNAAAPNNALPVTTEIHTFDMPEPEKLGWGVKDFVIKGKNTHYFELPGGSLKIKLVLPEKTAAALLNKGVMERIHWSGDKSKVVFFNTHADSIMFFHTENVDATASISARPISDQNENFYMESAFLYKAYNAGSGITNIGLKLSGDELAKGANLKIYNGYGVFTDKTGRVFTGNDIPVNNNGWLDIHHKTGLVAAWIEKGKNDPFAPDVMTSGFMASGSNSGVIEIDTKDKNIPSEIDLTGKKLAIRFIAKDDEIIHLKNLNPVIVGIRSGKRPLRVDACPYGANLYIRPSTDESGESVAEVIIYPAHTGLLSGKADISILKLIPINEGTGPAFRLGAGDARIFSFEVSRKTRVGMGVKSPADIAECRLMDFTGAFIGSGLVFMHTLNSGKYILAIECPADGGPVEVMPVLAGVRPPQEGPSDDVIRKYLKAAGLKAAGEDGKGFTNK